MNIDPKFAELMADVLRIFVQNSFVLCCLSGYWRGHRVPPAGLPIEQVLGEYSLS